MLISNNGRSILFSKWILILKSKDSLNPSDFGGHVELKIYVREIHQLDHPKSSINSCLLPCCDRIVRQQYFRLGSLEFVVLVRRHDSVWRDSVSERSSPSSEIQENRSGYYCVMTKKRNSSLSIQLAE